MSNNRALQILRGSENFDPATSNERLADGLLFFSKKTNQLYVGLKDASGNESQIQNLSGTQIGLPITYKEGILLLTATREIKLDCDKIDINLGLNEFKDKIEGLEKGIGACLKTEEFTNTIASYITKDQASNIISAEYNDWYNKAESSFIQSVNNQLASTEIITSFNNLLTSIRQTASEDKAEILATVSNMNGTVAGFNARIEGVESTTSQYSSAISGLLDSVGALEGSIGELEGSVGTFELRISGVETSANKNAAEAKLFATVIFGKDNTNYEVLDPNTSWNEDGKDTSKIYNLGINFYYYKLGYWYSTTDPEEAGLSVNVASITTGVKTELGKDTTFIEAIAEEVKIQGSEINLDGYVKFENLSGGIDSGETFINGANIITGTINAESLVVGTQKPSTDKGNGLLKSYSIKYKWSPSEPNKDDNTIEWLESPGAYQPNNKLWEKHIYEYVNGYTESYVIEREDTSPKGIITINITSSNGNLYRNGRTKTTLTALLMQGGYDVTNMYNTDAFIWKKDGSIIEDKSGITLEVNNNDFTNKAVYTCEVDLSKIKSTTN